MSKLHIFSNTAPWRTPPCRPSPRSSPSRRAPPSPRPPPRPSAPRAPAGPRSAPCPPPPAAGAAQRPPTPAAGSGTFHQSEVSTALHQSGLTCPRQCGPAARPAGRGAPPGPCSTAGLRTRDVALHWELVGEPSATCLVFLGLPYLYVCGIYLAYADICRSTHFFVI